MKQNRILLILVVLVATIIAWFVLSKSNSTLGKELQNFAIEDTASIDKIFIADKNGNSSTLERVNSSTWTVNKKYEARQDGIKTLLLTLNKMKVRNPVAKAMEPKVLRDLSGPVQKKVEIYSNGNLLKVIYMGVESMDKMGTYMLLENSSAPFEVHIPGHRGFLQSRFIVDEHIWRDISIFKYDYRDIRKIQVRYPEVPNQGFDLKYDGKNLELNNVGSSSPVVGLDTLKAFQYLNEFRRVVYEFIVVESFPKQTRDSIIASQPFVMISVTDKTGDTKEVKGFHRKTPGRIVEDPSIPLVPYDTDRLYGTINNDKDFVLIQFYQMGRILKTREWLLGGK